MTDNEERDKKAQGSGHARVDMSCEVRNPQEDYVPEDTPFNKDIRYALARSI